MSYEGGKGNCLFNISEDLVLKSHMTPPSGCRLGSWRILPVSFHLYYICFYQNHILIALFSKYLLSSCEQQSVYCNIHTHMAISWLFNFIYWGYSKMDRPEVLYWLTVVEFVLLLKLMIRDDNASYWRRITM